MCNWYLWSSASISPSSGDGWAHIIFGSSLRKQRTLRLSLKLESDWSQGLRESHGRRRSLKLGFRGCEGEHGWYGHCDWSYCWLESLVAWRWKYPPMRLELVTSLDGNGRSGYVRCGGVLVQFAKLSLMKTLRRRCNVLEKILQMLSSAQDTVAAHEWFPLRSWCRLWRVEATKPAKRKRRDGEMSKVSVF